MNRQQPFDIGAVQKVIAERSGLPGAMLPILHGIQESIGFVPADAVPMALFPFITIFDSTLQGVMSCKSAALKLVSRLVQKRSQNMRRACSVANSMKPARTDNSRWSQCIAWVCAPAAQT